MLCRMCVALQQSSTLKYMMYISGKYKDKMNSCLLSVESRNRSRNLVFGH
jgi:hypothetical protein